MTADERPENQHRAIDIALLLDALDALDALDCGTETSSSESSPLSYRSNGHDGLTDMDSGDDSHAPSGHQEPAFALTPRDGGLSENRPEKSTPRKSGQNGTDRKGKPSAGQQERRASPLASQTPSCSQLLRESDVPVLRPISLCSLNEDLGGGAAAAAKWLLASGRTPSIRNFRFWVGTKSRFTLRMARKKNKPFFLASFSI